MKIFSDFLRLRNLEMDNDIDYAIVLEEGIKVIASGAMSGPVLKCIVGKYRYSGAKLYTSGFWFCPF